MEYLENIPDRLIHFLLVTLFALLIGLSQRKVHIIDHKDQRIFGSDRTFTFIGILGYLLYVLRPSDGLFFLTGALILSGFLLVYYIFHIRNEQDYGITSVLVALITFCLGPIVETQPLWFALIIVVVVLIFSELKEEFASFSLKFDKDEFITLAKFLIITGVILPIVPDTPLMEGFSLTPYKIWLAVVVVSGISYISYLLKKFVLKHSSIVVAGFLGGLYSSTATTIILAKKSRKEPEKRNQYIAGILFATTMMYLRVLILILIFDWNLFLYSWPWFLMLIAWSLGVGLFVLFFRNRQVASVDTDLHMEKNQLEFKTALIFTGLFVVLSFLTFYILKHFGTLGLDFLSFVVGLVDIDPFLLSLFEGKFGIPMAAVLMATFQAIISNNLMKMIYAMIFAGKKTYLYLLTGFLLIIAVNAVILLIV